MLHLLRGRSWAAENSSRDVAAKAEVQPSSSVPGLAGANYLLSFPDLHRLHPGGREPIPDAAPVHPGAGTNLLQPPHGRAASPHLCHCQQLLLQHEEEQEGPVLYHQVRLRPHFWGRWSTTAFKPPKDPRKKESLLSLRFSQAFFLTRGLSKRLLRTAPTALLPMTCPSHLKNMSSTPQGHVSHTLTTCFLKTHPPYPEVCKG